MKTPSVVGLVVAAVLLTIAIEETRISRLRNEKQKPAPAMADTGENLRSSDSVSETADNGPVRTKTRAELKPAAAETNREAADEPILRTVRKMWDNPAGKSMMNQGLKIAVAMMYEDFIEDLNLTKEEADYFKTLLGKEMADQQELGMKMMGASDEERKELVAEIEQRKTANDEDIRKFLNNDADYQRYRDHKDRLPERQQLDGIRSAMAGKDAPLDAETEARLLDAMYQARTESKAPNLQGPEAMDAMANGSLVDSFEKNWQAQQDALRAATSDILNPTQQEALQEYQQQMKEMQLMGLKMAEKMMQGAKSPSE